MILPPFFFPTECLYKPKDAHRNKTVAINILQIVFSLYLDKNIQV